MPTGPLRLKIRGLKRISYATNPPIRKPSTSTPVFRPSALTNATALAAISSIVVDTSPELLDTPAFVKMDHLTTETIRHRWVPMIHRASEVLVEDQRYAHGLAKTAIREAGAVSLNELCGCGLMSVSDHLFFLILLSCVAIDDEERGARPLHRQFSPTASRDSRR